MSDAPNKITLVESSPGNVVQIRLEEGGDVTWLYLDGECPTCASLKAENEGLRVIIDAKDRIAAEDAEEVADLRRVVWALSWGMRGALDGVFAEYDPDLKWVLHTGDKLHRQFDPERLTGSDRETIDAAMAEEGE